MTLGFQPRSGLLVPISLKFTPKMGKNTHSEDKSPVR
jgi:hypothetical protein